jgi:putative PEP-CTERM system TPR-repeat lipoprotein
LLATGSSDAQALAMAGEASLLRRDPNRAVSYLASAAALDPGNIPLQTQLGLGHLVAGNTQLGISHLQATAARNDEVSDADILLVRAHLSRREFDLALAAIDAYEKKQPNTPQPHQLRAIARLGQGDSSAARQSFERALALDPLYFPAANGLAELDLRDNKPEAARQRFERILEKDKTHLQAMLALAQWSKLNKQEKVYLDWLDKAAKAHPKAIEPRAALVQELLAKGENQKALVLANDVVNSHPVDPVALNLLGNVQLALGDNLGALSTFTKLIRVAPQSPDAHMRLALAEIASKRKADARATLQTVLKLKPDHLQAQDAMLRLAVEDKRLEDAMRIARQLQSQHPGNPIGHEREGDVLILQKRPDMAFKAYEQALAKGAGSAGFIKSHRALTLAGNPVAQKKIDSWLAQHPKDTAVRFYAAEYYASTGRHQDAIAAYQALLTQAPGSAIVLNNLANSYQQVGDKRALETAEQAYKLNPDHPAILDTLGWLLVEKGQAGRGLELIEKALAKVPGNPDIRYHRVMALLAHKGDKVRARRELESLLKDAPTFSQAEAAKAQLQKL